MSSWYVTLGLTDTALNWRSAKLEDNRKPPNQENFRKLPDAVYQSLQRLVHKFRPHTVTCYCKVHWSHTTVKECARTPGPGTFIAVFSGTDQSPCPVQKRTGKVETHSRAVKISTATGNPTRRRKNCPVLHRYML